MKKIVCIVILILAITGLLNGISYLISGISARGIGGVKLWVGYLSTISWSYCCLFLKRRKKKKNSVFGKAQRTKNRYLWR